MTPTQKKHAESLIRQILQTIEPGNEDGLRPGIQKTPARVVKSWLELYAGYYQDPKEVLGTTFEQEGYRYNQMILCKDVEMYSTCEHHLLPFRGRAHIAYIPTERVVGLSKLARLVEVFARRLQIQEKLTSQIADTIEEVLKPKGVGVLIQSQHFCMCARGVGKQDSSMVTSALRGCFATNSETRAEFFNLVNGK
jgi:GTP cyclohydrolase IA